MELIEDMCVCLIVRLSLKLRLVLQLPGMPGRFRFFFGTAGFVWWPEEETLAASPEAVEALSKSTGMGTQLSSHKQGK